MLHLLISDDGNLCLSFLKTRNSFILARYCKMPPMQRYMEGRGFLSDI